MLGTLGEEEGGIITQARGDVNSEIGLRGATSFRGESAASPTGRLFPETRLRMLASALWQAKLEHGPPGVPRMNNREEPVQGRGATMADTARG